MLVILLAMLVTVALSALLAAYVAYPMQGKDIPRAEWLSGALHRVHRRHRAVERTGDRG